LVPLLLLQRQAAADCCWQLPAFTLPQVGHPAEHLEGNWAEHLEHRQAVHLQERLVERHLVGHLLVRPVALRMEHLLELAVFQVEHLVVHPLVFVVSQHL